MQFALDIDRRFLARVQVDDPDLVGKAGMARSYASMGFVVVERTNSDAEPGFGHAETGYVLERREGRGGL